MITGLWHDRLEETPIPFILTFHGASIRAIRNFCRGARCRDHNLLTLSLDRLQADFGSPLGRLWADPGPTWADFGPTLGRLGADFGPTLGRLWADFGPTLGRLQADFGPTLGHLWVDFGPTSEFCRSVTLKSSLVRTLGLKCPTPFGNSSCLGLSACRRWKPGGGPTWISASMCFACSPSMWRWAFKSQCTDKTTF